MLRDRYDPVDLFALLPQLGLQFEPQLAQLDRLLDDDEIFARVRADLGRHYPTHSALLGDGVRALSRLLRRAKAVVGDAVELGREAFRSRVRAVRTLTQQLHRIARRKGAEGREALKRASGRLIETAKRTGSQTRRVLEVLTRSAEKKAQHLAEQMGQFPPRLQQGIGQATRRGLGGESVPAGEGLLSVFEPHTQIVPRFKAGKPVELGRELRLDEVEGGLVTGSQILDPGGGQDQPDLKDSLATHRRHFGRAPDLLAADRGLASAENERLARQAGVRRIALPGIGRASPQRRAREKQRWFRRGYRFRAGIEGRIHVLRRDFGLKRCGYRGERGLGRWVGWGILTHNLAKIAEAGASR